MKSQADHGQWRTGRMISAPLRAVAAMTFSCSLWGHAQSKVMSVVPDADSFVRSLEPTNNYGGGGALSVSGSAAVNGSGVQNGLFDTLMRFPMSNVVAFVDSALGAHDWIVTEARLVLSETAVPDNSIFNQGVGGFEVRWLVSNDWIEGTGKPIASTSDGVTWQDLPQILTSSLDVSLGVFTNSGANGQVSFSLALAEPFLADLRLGAELSLYLTARNPEVGFTFNSRNFGNTNAQPMLVMTAVVNPKPPIDSIRLKGWNVLFGLGTASTWA